MANKLITDYTAAVTIDATADYLLEYQASSGVYKKINRNTLLGITGNPIGTTDSQSLSNKTIGNTNIVTVKDANFTLQDDADTTKQAQFQLSGITTGTTRTYTLPNATDTLAGIATTQTLTNKTLTSPTINGGTIDNATITVDSISGHTTSTIVTVGGLQISGGVLNTNNSVVTANIADSAVTPAKLFTGTGSSWVWTSYTPTWSSGVTAIGNATQTCSYTQIGKTVFVRMRVVFGSTTTFSASPFLFSLPITATTNATGIICGTSYIEDSGVAGYIGFFQTSSTTLGQLNTGGVTATYLTNGAATSAVPFTWGTGDFFYGQFTYEAA